MVPALAPGERVLFDRLAYVLNDPRTGEIVLTRHRERPGVRMIKRVADGDGFVGGQYWLLGDKADESTDSRTLGAFRREDILARAWVVYWPAGRFRVLDRGNGQSPYGEPSTKEARRLDK
jgi:signal peptidase I